MTPVSTPTIALSQDVAIPQVGFGVFQVPPDETQRAVEAALEAGYRHVDTATIYGNEAGVGAALAASGIPRTDMFVTSKLWPHDFAMADVRPGIERSLERLGLDHVDLYLLHWPVPAVGRYVGAWQGLLSAQQEGLIRVAGVSNFVPDLLAELERTSGVMPPVNQVKLHPALQQQGLQSYHHDHGIVTEAYSPLAQAEVLGDPVIAAIAERLGVTPAQAVLRWHIQSGRVVIPKSVHPARMSSNLDVCSFELSNADMTAIGALDDGPAIWDGPMSFTP